MDKPDNYLYYIIKNPYDIKLKRNRELPGIFRVQISQSRDELTLADHNEGEGPFKSLYELRRNSTIFNDIKLQKHKEQITKNRNIETIKEGLLTKTDTSFEKNFVDSFSHITIGKISRKKLQGIHFYNPDKIKIIKRVEINNETGVWSAKIKKQNENTGEWVEKEDVTNFSQNRGLFQKPFWNVIMLMKTKNLVQEIHILGRQFVG